MLDEHIVKTHAMRGSPYIAPFEERIATWSKTLARIQEIFDEWLLCQRTWLYLYPIFTADDIQRQIPAEARRPDDYASLMTTDDHSPQRLTTAPDHGRGMIPAEV